MINPFGYIFLIFLGCCFARGLKSPGLFLIFIKIELFLSFFKFNYGFFINIGDMEIQYGEVVIGLLSLMALIKLVKIKVSRKVLFDTFMLLSVIIIGIFSLILYPASAETIGFNTTGWDAYLRGDVGNLQPVYFSSQSVLMFVRVVCFVVVMMAVKATLVKKDWMDISDFLAKASKFLIVFCFLEVFLKFGLNIDPTSVLNDLFGRGIATGSSQLRLQGLSREPSYFALALFNVIALFILRIANGKKFSDEGFWFFSALVLGLLSGSFSFVWIMFCLSILYYCLFAAGKRSNRKLLYSVFYLFLGSIIFSFGYILVFLAEIKTAARVTESLYQITNAFSGSYIVGVDISSEAARFIGMAKTLEGFLTRPLIGLGLGTAYCVSGIFSILANIGLLGFFYWLRLVTRSYFKLSALLSFSLFLPLLITNDLNALYDFVYITMVPLFYYAHQNVLRKNSSRSNEENYSFSFSKYS